MGLPSRISGSAALLLAALVTLVLVTALVVALVLLLATLRVDDCFLTPPLAPGFLGALPLPLAGVLDVLQAISLLLGVAAVPWPSPSRTTPSHWEESRLSAGMMAPARPRPRPRPRPWPRPREAG